MHRDFTQRSKERKENAVAAALLRAPREILFASLRETFIPREIKKGYISASFKNILCRLFILLQLRLPNHCLQVYVRSFHK
jgi:hypothetical protein